MVIEKIILADSKSLCYLFNALKGCAPDIAFHFDFAGDGVDHGAAGGDDGMEADVVGIGEGLAEAVGCLHTAVGGVQGVDAVVGRAAGVGGLAAEHGLLDHAAVAAAGAAELGPDAGVDHKGQIHTVEIAAVEELRLAAQILDLALLDKT